MTTPPVDNEVASLFEAYERPARRPALRAGSLTLLGIILAALVILAVGCVSPAFRAAAPISLLWTEQARAYLAADKTLADDVHASRLADLTTLEQAVSADNLTVDSVDSAWQRFRGWYLAYLAGDPRFDEAARQMHIERAGQFDRLIATERSRPFGISTGGSTVPASAGQTIASRPTTNPAATPSDAAPPAPTP